MSTDTHRSELDLTVPAPVRGLAGTPTALRDALVVTRRNLTHIRRLPEKLLDVTVQPVTFVVLFAYVFGAAITVPGVGYREFLMAGVFTQTVVFLSVTTAVGFTTDLASGVMDRFRSLPMARSAVVAGRTLADLVHCCLGIAVMTVTALVVGWRSHGGFGRTLAGFALLLLFGFAMIWVGTLFGLVVRSTEGAQTIGFTVLFPLTFVANTFVPTAGMPGWMRVVADWNPVSATVAACRQLWGNDLRLPGSGPTVVPLPLQRPVLTSVLYSLLIIAAVAPVAVRRYRTALSR